MSKISTLLDTDSVDFNPDMHEAVFAGLDDNSTIVELYNRINTMWEAYM